MFDLPTAIVLGLAALLCLAASGVMAARLRRKAAAPSLVRVQSGLVIAVTALIFGLLAYRAGILAADWHPLQTHLDGLLTIAALLAATMVYLQTGRRLPGLAGFMLPLLTIILAWAFCGSMWTLQPPWHIGSIWDVFHLTAAYGGMLFMVVAATAGVMFLYVEHRLRRRHDVASVRPFASLEALDRVMVTAATLGFALLTLGLVTGTVMMTGGDTELPQGWWYAPKIVLATAAWSIYALVMNVRFSSTFTGTRAAWLCIVGLVLLIATFGAVSALADPSRQSSASGVTTSSKAVWIGQGGAAP